ncbi:hypothetical protein Esti_000019 [Eimeria stiedai]
MYCGRNSDSSGSSSTIPEVSPSRCNNSSSSSSRRHVRRLTAATATAAAATGAEGAAAAAAAAAAATPAAAAAATEAAPATDLHCCSRHNSSSSSSRKGSESSLASQTFKLQRALSAAAFYTTHPALLSRELISWLREPRLVGAFRRGPLGGHTAAWGAPRHEACDAPSLGGGLLETTDDPSEALAALWGPQADLSVEAFLAPGLQDWKQLLSAETAAEREEGSSSSSFSEEARTARDKIQTLEEQLRILASLLEEATLAEGALEGGPPDGDEGAAAYSSYAAAAPAGGAAAEAATGAADAAATTEATGLAAAARAADTAAAAAGSSSKESSSNK